MRRTVICVFVVLLVILVGVTGCKTSTKTKVVPKKEALVLNSTERILIVAPHPDDESLAPAGLIQKAISQDIPVKVVMMTTGDGYKHATELNLHVLDPKPEDYRKLGEMRRLETLAAMRKLGLKDEDVTFLAFNDGSVNSLWGKNWDYDKLHLGLNGALESPYDFAYQPRSPYCGDQVVKELTEIILDYGPTTIVFPSAEDVHHDHWATNAFVQYTLAKEEFKVRELQYLVHRGRGWPTPLRLARKKELSIPHALQGIKVTWIWKPMSKSEEDLKEQALNSYNTQKIVAVGFLDAFVRENELFMKYTIPDLVQVDNAPTLDSKGLPGQVAIDPNDDSLLDGPPKGGDLEVLWLFRDAKTLWLIGDVRNETNPDIIYALHIRYIKKDKVERLDVEVKDGKPTVPIYATNSITEKIEIEHDEETGRVAAKIPADRLNNADYIMIDVETYKDQIDENHWLDRTAWQRIRIR